VAYGWLSKRKMWLLVMLFPLLLAACGAATITIPVSEPLPSPTFTENSGNSIGSGTFASEAGPLVNNFPKEWNKCGGSGGIGKWITGPKWYQNRYLVMVYRNAVLGWDVRYPEKGIFPLALNGHKVKHSGRGVQLQDMQVVNGVKVATEFLKWIEEHGGWACSGPPVSDLISRGDSLCQEFANLTLCYSRNGEMVYPLPLGEHFFETHADLFSDEPKVEYWPDWFVQPAIEAEGETLLKISVSPVSLALSSLPPVALAIQVRENNVSYPFYYRLVRLQKGNFSDVVKVPKLSRGSSRFIVRACVYYEGKWVSCGDNSTQIWKP